MAVLLGRLGRRRFYYGWVIVVVAALVGFTHRTETYTVLTVFANPVTQEFGWSRTFFAIPITLGSIHGGLLGPRVGPLIDRFGPRRMLTAALRILGDRLVLTAGIRPSGRARSSKQWAVCSLGAL